MYDHQLYLRTLSEFTRVLLTPYDVQSVLAELTARVTAVLGLLGSGVSLGRADRLVFDTAVGKEVAEVEQVQQRTQEGPCVAAYRSGEGVSVSDLAAGPDRWPEYNRAAARVGIQAVASIPLKLAEQPVGALNLYASEPREWDPDDMAAAVVMGDMATGYLLNASKHRQQVELADQLQHALDSRVVIEQAKGMLAARHQITPDAAFERLRHHARGRGVGIHAVSDAVVHLGMEL